MSDAVNRIAPNLGFKMSENTMKEVEHNIASGYVNPLASRDSQAIRRSNDERDIPNCVRPAYVRDTEKILHMPAYNRLAGKTQVFSFDSDDDLSRRGLHVQLVSRVARDIGRALGLNLDLIEAIAMGHDVGHTPFGHAGENCLNKIFNRRTGKYFYHNLQSVRVLDTLYARNISLQVLDGVLCHNGECERQKFSLSGLSSFDEFDKILNDCVCKGDSVISKLKPMTLEGCVVRISDIIAYVGKDRQDAMRLHRADADTFDDGLGSGYNSWALDTFISDIVEHSLDKPYIAMSEEAFSELKRAKSENGTKIYMKSEFNGPLADTAKEYFEQVYCAALEDLKGGGENTPIMRHHIIPVERELKHYERKYLWQDDFDQTVVDYIASMTDNYFVSYVKRLNPNAHGLFPHRDYFN